MKDISKAVKLKVKDVVVGYRRLKSQDLIISTLSKGDLTDHLLHWKEKLKKYDMNISINKTKIMYVGTEGLENEVGIKDHQIQQVEKVKYLGPIIETIVLIQAQNSRFQNAWCLRMKIFFLCLESYTLVNGEFVYSITACKQEYLCPNTVIR
ncbi:uncharacterized protein LOC135127341 [Zophobas morio]|uniref:uncharacterized protein LOC135127341 n=1 Tax=Zophobas morio TaxID=2755281 RepID=UPI0030832F42